MDNCKGKQIDILIYSTAKRFTLKKKSMLPFSFRKLGNKIIKRNILKSQAMMMACLERRTFASQVPLFSFTWHYTSQKLEQIPCFTTVRLKMKFLMFIQSSILGENISAIKRMATIYHRCTFCNFLTLSSHP